MIYEMIYFLLIIHIRKIFFFVNMNMFIEHDY